MKRELEMMVHTGSFGWHDTDNQQYNTGTPLGRSDSYFDVYFYYLIYLVTQVICSNSTSG